MGGYDITCDPGDLYTRKCYVNVHSPSGCLASDPACTITQQEIISYTGGGDPISKAPSSNRWQAWVPTLTTLNQDGVAYQPYGDAGLPFTATGIAGYSDTPFTDDGSDSTDSQVMSDSVSGGSAASKKGIPTWVGVIGAVGAIAGSVFGYKKWKSQKGTSVRSAEGSRVIKNAELGKDSCCCGATAADPCACMIQGVMDCSATCPCSLAKDAETFDAEGGYNWGMGVKQRRRIFRVINNIAEQTLDLAKKYGYGEEDGKIMKRIATAFSKGQEDKCLSLIQELDTDDIRLLMEMVPEIFVSTDDALVSADIQLVAESFDAECKGDGKECPNCDKDTYHFICSVCDGLGNYGTDESNYQGASVKGPHSVWIQWALDNDMKVVHGDCNPSRDELEREGFSAETFEAPYGGKDALMGITQKTDLSDFTPEELATSSAIHGDFNKASLDYSGHQNIQVRSAEEV